MCGKSSIVKSSSLPTLSTTCFVGILVYVYDVDREIRTLINKLQGHCSAVYDASFNGDESLLASCDQQGLVIVWQRDHR